MADDRDKKHDEESEATTQEIDKDGITVGGPPEPEPPPEEPPSGN